jgi:CubicO group peptidase (beta-lactamase class C family)
MRAHYFLVLITSCTIAFAQTSHSTKPDFSAIREQLRAHVGNNDVPGLAIAVSRGGEVLWEEGFGWADRERHVQATPTMPFYIASVTKSVTATAVMHLAERGRLRLDDPVNKYLGATKVHSPVWNSSDATIRRVMSQTSGLTTFSRWCINATDPHCDIDSEIERYGVLVWPPGEVFDYSNLSYGIMGDVVARVSGESFESYLRTAIFQPLNMQDCYLVPGGTAKRTSAQYDQKTHTRSPSRVSGHEGASGLHCSARDLLSFGMFNLKEHLGPGSPLSIRDIDDMHSAQPGTAGQYGFGWWIRQESGVEIISAQGGTSDAYALLELIPANEIAIVVIANSYSQLVSGLERQIISGLLPGSSADKHTSGSQPGGVSLAPVTLAGKWSGQILTYKAPINITLDLGNGSAQGEVDHRPGSTVTNVSLDDRHFYGQLPGEPGLPDSPTRPFIIELDLALHDDKLIEAATFGPLPGEDGDQLPHFINLARTKP